MIKTALLLLLLNLTSIVLGRGRGQSFYSEVYRPNVLSYAEFRNSFEYLPPQKLQLLGKPVQQDSLLFVNERNRGIHVIDNSSPQSPKVLGFIKILGNLHFIIKDNILYADSYSDLVVVDISQLHYKTPELTLLKRIEDLYPYNAELQLDLPPCEAPYPLDYFVGVDTISGVVVDWNVSQKRTRDKKAVRHMDTGEMGKERGFIIHDSVLYMAFNSTVYSFDISNPQECKLIKIYSCEGRILSIELHRNMLHLTAGRKLVLLSLDLEKIKVYEYYRHWGYLEPYKDKLLTLTAYESSSQLGLIDTDKEWPYSLVRFRVFNGNKLLVTENRLFVGSDSYIHEYDLTAVSEEMDMAEIKKRGSKSKIKAYHFTDMALQDKILIVTTRLGLSQYDISNPTLAKEISRIPSDWGK